MSGSKSKRSKRRSGPNWRAVGGLGLVVIVIALMMWQWAAVPSATGENSGASLGISDDADQIIVTLQLETSGWGTELESIDDVRGVSLLGAFFASEDETGANLFGGEGQGTVADLAPAMQRRGLPRGPSEEAPFLVVIWQVDDCALLPAEADSFSAVVSDRFGRSRRVAVGPFGPARLWLSSPETGVQCAATD